MQMALAAFRLEGAALRKAGKLTELQAGVLDDLAGAPRRAPLRRAPSVTNPPRDPAVTAAG